MQEPYRFKADISYKKDFLYLSQEELPKKVLSICQSVIRMYNQGQSFYKMTISDIAKEANIGKGTVYEYFDTKEEIIVTAMLLELKNQVMGISEVILQKNTFDEKYDAAMNWIWETVRTNVVIRQMLITRYSENADEVSCEIFGRLLSETRAGEVLHSIIDAGVKEGLFQQPENALQEKSAYVTFAYGIAVMLRPEEFGNCNETQVKQYCKKMFIVILSE